MSAGKPTTCKDAIRRWEEDNGQEASTALEVNLIFQWPPIEKLDNSLATLSSCEKLSLSTNMIEKIAGDEWLNFFIKNSMILLELKEIKKDLINKLVNWFFIYFFIQVQEKK